MRQIEADYRSVIETVRRIPDKSNKVEIVEFTEETDAHGRPTTTFRFAISQKQHLGCLALIVLFVTIIGLLIYFFLPAKPRAAGALFVTDVGAGVTWIEGIQLDNEIVKKLAASYTTTDVQSEPETTQGLMASNDHQAAGWHRDPTGKHELRYWDGATFTDHVSDAGATSTDAM